MSLELITDTGTYTGNSSTQSVIIGWQPALVIITSSKTGGSGATRCLAFKMSDMADDDFLECSNDAIYTTTNGVTITATGFDLGSDDVINDSGYDFYWMAFREGPTVDTGTYTGNASATQAIPTGRQPGAVFICQTTGTESAIWKAASQGAALATAFVAAVGSEASLVTLDSSGFTAEGIANTDGETYVWCALYDIVGSTRHIESGGYAGDDAGTRTVTLGYQPRWALILTSDGAELPTKVDSAAGGGFGNLASRYDWMSSGIEITATGFTLTGVCNSVGVDYRWLVGVY